MQWIHRYSCVMDNAIELKSSLVTCHKAISLALLMILLLSSVGNNSEKKTHTQLHSLARKNRKKEKWDNLNTPDDSASRRDTKRFLLICPSPFHSPHSYFQRCLQIYNWFSSIFQQLHFIALFYCSLCHCCCCCVRVSFTLNFVQNYLKNFIIESSCPTHFWALGSLFLCIALNISKQKREVLWHRK